MPPSANFPKPSAAFTRQFEILDVEGVNNRIFHYCSPETFLAILNSKKLRFGDASSLNDGEELIWGLELIQRVKKGDG